MSWGFMNRFIGKTTKYVKENQLVVLFLTVFCIGIILGALSLRCFSDTDTNLPLLFQQFISLRTREFSRILFNSLFTCVFPLFLLYCFGLFLYGYVPCLVLMLIQGISHGAVCGYIYTAYGLKGAAFILLIVLPSAFIITIVHLVGSKASFQFSVILSKTHFCDTVLVQPSVHLKRYHYKFLILAGFAVVAAVTDSLLSHIFIRVFGF